jgi:hypothetical protein
MYIGSFGIMKNIFCWRPKCEGFGIFTLGSALCKGVSSRDFPVRGSEGGEFFPMVMEEKIPSKEIWE